MEFLKEFILENGLELIYVIVATVISFFTYKIKNTYTKYVNTETSKSIVELCVNACEQIYTEEDGTEKYEIALNNIKEILESKNINLTDLEIEMMIEAFCNSLKSDDTDE